MQLSKMQNEYIVNATHRWNIKSGAVRSGKSFVDTAFVIPFRIRERAGKPGLNVILGVSKESIERNVLQPMREIYTDKLVGNINNRNIARVCGEDVYCLGAEKVSQVAKIQGASILITTFAYLINGSILSSKLQGTGVLMEVAKFCATSKCEKPV